MSEQQINDLNFLIILKSGESEEIHLKICDFKPVENTKFYSLFCSVDKPLSKGIQNITIPEIIWNLKSAILSIQSEEETHFVWIKEQDHRIYIVNINNKEIDDRSIEFLKECIICGFDSPEKLPPNIYNEKGNVVYTHLACLRDEKQRDLLMFAYKKQRFNLFSILLQLDFKLDRRDFTGELPIDYAAKKLKNLVDNEMDESHIKAYKAAIEDLLCAGSPYSKENYFEYYKNSQKVKEILDASSKMRLYTTHFNISKIKELRTKFPRSLFYDESNNSLMRFVIKKKLPRASYLQNRFNFQIGDHEELEIYKNIIVGNNKNFYIVHNIMLKKFRNINGEQLHGDQLICIKEALESLNEDEMCSPFLYLCGASKQLIFFMDFDLEYFKDPEISGKTFGITNTHGNTYISAKNLLDESNKSQVLGAIAHELCHQAMQLTYWNNLNPFSQGPISSIYEKVFQNIKENIDKNDEITIINVFLYKEEEQRSELIVTLPQMIVQNPSSKLEIQKKYPELCSFMYNTVLPDVKKTVPVFVRLQLEEENLKYPFLTPPMQKKLIYSPILYDGNETTYFKAFGKNTDHLCHLTPLIIKNIIMNNEVLNISKKFAPKRRKLEDAN